MNALGQQKVHTNKQNGNESVNKSKIDNETEQFHHKKVPKDIAQSIVTGRCNKKMTQEALAKALNMQQKEIAEIETCKAIYNGGHLAKIKRYLGI